MTTIDKPFGELPLWLHYEPIIGYIDFLTGPAFESSNYNQEEQGVRLARGINIGKGHTRWPKNNTRFWELVTSDLEKYLLAECDLIIGMDGSLVGRNFAQISVKDLPCLLVQRVARVRAKTGLDIRYLYYTIASDYWLSYVDLVKTNSGIPHISNSDIKHFNIPLPTLANQKKIAKILSTVDKLIEQTQALIDKYTAIKQGMMADLFTRGIDLSGTAETNPNHGQLRPTFEEAPELYKETELGWIPREWEVCTLGSLLKSIDAGWSPNCPEIRPSTGQWGVLKVSAVTRGFYEPSEAKTLPIGLEPDTSIEVKNGDVIMTRANGVAELVGLTVQVIDSPKKLMLSDKLLRLNPNFKVITKNYLLLVMNSNSIRTQIVKRLSGSSGQRNISQSEIKKFKVCCGSTGEQMIITKNVYALSNKIKLEKKLANKLQKQKKGLMQDLLTGKVRVNP
jgi:type I restriction enzyme S subunit